MYVRWYIVSKDLRSARNACERLRKCIKKHRTEKKTTKCLQTIIIK